MKKLLLLFLSTLMIMSLVSCGDELTGISIEDDNQAQQWNQDIEGNTYTLSISGQTLNKDTTVSNASNNNDTLTSEEIVLSQKSFTVTFSEMEDGVGTFTMSYSEVFTAAADAKYDAVAENVANGATTTVEYDGDPNFQMDNSNFAGVEIESSSFTGSYRMVERENKSEYYVLFNYSGTETSNNNANISLGTTLNYTTQNATADVDTWSAPVNTLSTIDYEPSNWDEIMDGTEYVGLVFYDAYGDPASDFYDDNDSSGDYSSGDDVFQRGFTLVE